jgi:hypothetical protein
MLKKIALAVAFIALGSMSALAADFNGKWTGEVPGRDGNPQTISFDFKVDGATLTGKVTTPRGDNDITNGKVDGDSLSFDQVITFGDNNFTIHYAGKADGATIKFTRSFGSGGPGGDRPPTEFVAKKAQ